jgi:hypothetical protein
MKTVMFITMLIGAFGVLSAHGIMNTWTWTGVGPDNSWTTITNWTSLIGGSPQNGGNVQFAGNTRLAPNNNIINLSLNELLFAPGSGAFTVTGNAVSLGGAGGIMNNSSATQTIGLPLTLTANQQFGATSGPLVFSDTIDGAHNLTLLGPFAITLEAAVGGMTPLTSLTSTGGVVTMAGASVITIGNQTYSGSVTFDATSSLTSTGGATIAFKSTIDGPGALTLAAGPVVFQMSVGGAAPLYTLTVTGLTTFGGGTVITAGGQTYNGSATFATTTSLTSTGGATIAFASTVDGPGALTLNGGAFAFQGAMGGAAPLATLTLNGVTTFSGGTVVTAGGQTYNGSVTLATDTSLTSTGGNITVQAVNGTGNNLTITASGATTFNHTLTAVDSLIVSASVLNVSATATVIVNSATFSASMNNSGIIVAAGCPLIFNGPVVNNGIIEALKCPIVFTSTLINNGTIITSNCPPVITAIHVAAPDVQISFTTCSNAPYVVDYDTNLVSGTWTVLTNVTGTGNIMSVIDPGAAALPQRFYRAGLIAP